MFLCFRGKRFKSLGVSPYVLMFLCPYVYRVSGCKASQYQFFSKKFGSLQISAYLCTA